MKKGTQRLLPLTIAALILLTASPMVFASTLTVNLNPATKTAKVTSVSTTSFVLTYPSGTPLSNYLKGVNSSFSFKGSFTHTDSGVLQLQGSFDEEDDHVYVQNATISTSVTAKGNTTALVIHKETDITATVTGVFEVVNGTVSADLKWRSYVVAGALNFNLEGHIMDVNTVGSSMEESLGTQSQASVYLIGAFGGYGLWHSPTLNYSALSTPLSTWTMNYDKSTNTTTYSKTISGKSTLTASFNDNGKVYTLSVVSDPSATVSMPGYAVAHGDSLVIQPAPAGTSTLVWALVAAAVVVGAGAFIALRKRAVKANIGAATSNPV